MNTLLFAAYVLVWPAISTAILAILLIAVWRDYRSAKEEGRELI